MTCRVRLLGLLGSGLVFCALAEIAATVGLHYASAGRIIKARREEENARYKIQDLTPFFICEDAISEEIHRDSSVHFLPKPFTLKALAGMVKEVMEE